MKMCFTEVEKCLKKNKSMDALDTFMLMNIA